MTTGGPPEAPGGVFFSGPPSGPFDVRAHLDAEWTLAEEISDRIAREYVADPRSNPDLRTHLFLFSWQLASLEILRANPEPYAREIQGLQEGVIDLAEAVFRQAAADAGFQRWAPGGEPGHA